MKGYSQFLKELPSKKIVFAFGRFQPPTIGHELLVKAVKKLAVGADHVIYASRTQDKKKNPLPVDRKVYYLRRMFPGVNFAEANDQQRTFLEVAKFLNKKYKDIIMVAGSDRVAEYKKLLEKYNGTEFKFNSIQVISAGERDPDSDSATGMSATKMRAAAVKGDFMSFKRGLPHTMTNVDARRLMNEIRQGMGHDPVRESIKFDIDTIREQYFRGQIFNEGDIVEMNDEVYTVIKRGTNHLLIEDSYGEKVSAFLKDVQLIDENKAVRNKAEKSGVSYNTLMKVYKRGVAAWNSGHRPGTTPEQWGLARVNSYITKGKTYHTADKDLREEDDFPSVRKDKESGLPQKYVSGLSKSTAKKRAAHWKKADKLSDKDPNAYKPAPGDAKAETKPSKYTKKYKELYGEGLEELQEMSKDLIFTAADKIKVARIIATTLGVDNAQSSSNAKELVNKGLRMVRRKPLTKNGYQILMNMLKTARVAGIDYDEKLLPQQATAAVEESANRYSPLKQAREKQEKMDRAKKDAPKRNPGTGMKSESTDEVDDLVEAMNHAKSVKYQKASIELRKYGVQHGGIDKKDFIKIADMFMFDTRVDDQARQGYGAQKILNAIFQNDTDVRDKMMEIVTKAFGTKWRNSRPSTKEIFGESAVVDTSRNDNISQSIMRYSDLMKMLGKNPIEKAENAYQDDDFVAFPDMDKPEQTETGTTLDASQNADQLRRRKVQYHLGEEIEQEIDESWDPFFEELEDMEDDEIDKMVDDMDDDDLIDAAYDDEDLAIVDDESGEEVEDDDEDEPENKEQVQEVLSRMERIRAKQRLVRTKAKRARATKIALRKYSTTNTINARARRAATKALKQRFAKGRDIKKLSVAEKERLEKRLAGMKNILNRIAVKMIPKVRKLEKQRLSHKKFTK